ncbi:Uncharacterised protein [Serratia fonticola]|uniref:Uncharacterized protein n=1 Tax=Serratia fonticola TaxID=47917 RepID=A0A4U9UK93_SERFO|nr:Uncharacterised protein [Serratia fonticola]
MVFASITYAKPGAPTGYYCSCPILLVIGLYAVMIVLGGDWAAVWAARLRSLCWQAITVILFVPMLAAINGILATLQHDLYVNNLRFGTSPFVAKFKKSGVH